MSLSSLLTNASAGMSQMARRVDAQLQFARMLLDWHPGQAGKSITAAIESAEKIANKAFAKHSPTQIAKAVREIEAALAPAAKIAKSYTIYCVGHAHIDMNWMWGYPETVAVCNDSFTTVLKLMDEFPSFVFSQSQASVYRIVEEYNPDLLKQIQEKVKERRWEITASHWVEGDRNMVSGESLTRHLLYTRKYLKQLFNLEPEDVQIDWSPDTFGHPVSVPMYLTRGGVRYVYLHRPGAVGEARPQAFWWQSPDGSRVLVRNDMNNGYNGRLDPGILNPLKRFRDATGLPFVMFVYGIGDHGGGPTRRDLAMAVEMDSWPCFPNVIFSRTDDFYKRLEAEGSKLPTLKCELNMELAGCYTTQSLIKKSNRVAEHRLLDAEAFTLLAASATGRPVPSAKLEIAWQDTLFSHFHDILPGSNVHDSRTWMHGQFQKTIATTTMAETLALRAMAAKINTAVPGVAPAALKASSDRAVLGSGAGFASDRNMIDSADTSGGGPRSLVIFNPTAADREEVVEAILWTDVWAGHVTDEMRNRPLTIRTPDGKLLAPQKLEFSSYWGHAFVRIAFPARVPSLGYAAYAVLEQETAASKQIAKQIVPPYHCSYVLPDRRPEGIENDLLRMEIEPSTGGIKSLEDKRTGTSLAGPLPWGLEYALEKPHGMTAWVVDHAVEFAQPDVLGIERRLDGPYKATAEVKLRVKSSDFTLIYELRAGDPRLYIHLRGTWMERGTPQTGVPSLRFVMPLEMDEIKTSYEIPFATIDRDLARGEEVPALNFAMLSGKVNNKPAGLLVLNDSKHGHSLDEETFRITLIRSAYDPDPLPEIGQHEIHLALMPFTKPLAPSEAIIEGKSFNRPLRLVTTPLHEGALPAASSALQVKGALLTSIKAAEDGQGIILHFANPDPANAVVKAKLNAELLQKFSSGAEVDLMERELAGNKAELQRNTLTLPIAANSIAAVRLK